MLESIIAIALLIVGCCTLNPLWFIASGVFAVAGNMGNEED